MVGPRTGQKEAHSGTPAMNVGLHSYGYPGHLGYNNGPYLNWGLYGHRHLPNVATHTKVGYYGHPGHLGYYNGYHNGMWGRFSPCHYPYQGYILGGLRKNLKAFKKGGDGIQDARYRNKSKN